MFRTRCLLDYDTWLVYAKQKTSKYTDMNFESVPSPESTPEVEWDSLRIACERLLHASSSSVLEAHGLSISASDDEIEVAEIFEATNRSEMEAELADIWHKITIEDQASAIASFEKSGDSAIASLLRNIR